MTAFTVVPSRSGAVRTFEQRTVLEQFNPRCVAVSLSGYIFFGSSVKISDKVLEVNGMLFAMHASADLHKSAVIHDTSTDQHRSCQIMPGACPYSVLLTMSNTQEQKTSIQYVTAHSWL